MFRIKETVRRFQDIIYIYIHIERCSDVICHRYKINYEISSLNCTMWMQRKNSKLLMDSKESHFIWAIGGSFSGSGGGSQNFEDLHTCSHLLQVLFHIISIYDEEISLPFNLLSLFPLFQFYVCSPQELSSGSPLHSTDGYA